eukprot:4329926-Pyramimonas_sp.AAC.1
MTRRLPRGFRAGASVDGGGDRTDSGNGCRARGRLCHPGRAPRGHQALNKTFDHWGIRLSPQFL